MFGEASMGPRLGRVEYIGRLIRYDSESLASMGPRLGRVEYAAIQGISRVDVVLQWGHA